jgi:hypothetical protein
MQATNFDHLIPRSPGMLGVTAAQAALAGPAASVMRSQTFVLAGSMPAATARHAMSRSVMTPKRMPSLVVLRTGNALTPRSRILLAASTSEASGETDRGVVVCIFTSRSRCERKPEKLHD